MDTESCDFLIIGAGMAGASVGALLANHARVILLEMESMPGYHATGRSAAYFSTAYGNRVIRTLSKASSAFYYTPPDHFSDVPLLRARDCMFIARADQIESLNALKAELDNQAVVLEKNCILKRVPIFKEDYLALGLNEAQGGDLDVNAIHQGYLRLLKRRQGSIVANAEVKSLERKGGHWIATTAAGCYAAPVVVNAAGAWADQVAEMAELQPLGITPKRRTMILLEAPPGLDINDWPFVVDADEKFYFKPDAGKILLSPADETPSPPCDSQPEELDIATAVSRFEEATTYKVRRISNRWAGLRSFAPDKTPVVGFDSREEGFFWLAGQGGYGIQTAPALAEIVTHILTATTIAHGIEPALEVIDALCPERLIG